MSEDYSIDIEHPPRSKRISNRIGLQEIDEDCTMWLSSGKVYSLVGSASSSDSKESNEDEK